MKRTQDAVFPSTPISVLFFVSLKPGGYRQVLDVVLQHQTDAIHDAVIRRSSDNVFGHHIGDLCVCKKERKRVLENA